MTKFFEVQVEVTTSDITRAIQPKVIENVVVANGSPGSQVVHVQPEIDNFYEITNY